MAIFERDRAALGATVAELDGARAYTVDVSDVDAVADVSTIRAA